MFHSIKLFTLAFLLAMLCSNLKAQDCVSSPVSVFGDLSVNGTKIVDQNNNVVSFAGNSLFWSNTGFGAEKFYNAQVVDWLQEDWGATIVRAAMGVDEFGGFLSDPQGNRQRVETIVDAAIANDMYVIIDWHSHHAEDYRNQAIAFFEDMARKYGDHPNVIYEIYNEPLGVSWSQTIKPYSEAVIAAIRAIDPDNLIIVGTPFFSQEVDVASNDPIEGYDNIAYTLHFYAGTHGESLRQRARTALNNGIALMVTEWGTVNANGDGGVNQASTDQWMAFLRENDISHLNWSIHDKNEGASALRPGANVMGGWPDNQLTFSGLVVRDIIEGWHDCADAPAIPSGGNNNDANSLAYPDGIAHAIPGFINATQYDTGGSGVSYFDTDNGNNGSGVRQGESVDTENRSGGGNVGWIRSGEWLEFTVDVQTAGSYLVAFEVAARRDVGSRLHLEFEGQNVTGNVQVPSTGNWSNFTVVMVDNVQLNSGQQTMRISFDRGGFNLGDVAFELEDGSNQPAMEPAPPAPQPAPEPEPEPEPEPAPQPEPEPAPMPTLGLDDCVPVSMPYAQDGEGLVCLEVSGSISFINSWNMDSLTINGVDFTNSYAGSGSLPDPINGSYFIEYEASFPWSHFEVNGVDD